VVVVVRRAKRKGRAALIARKSLDAMSALPPKADIAKRRWDVRFVPKADIRRLFDYLVGTGQYRRRNGNTERFSRFEIDD
jgi:hypothetical protein